MLAPRTNFDSIDSAMTTVFIIIIGEDWPGIMYDYMRVYRNYGRGKGYASLYSGLVSVFFMVCFIVGNLLLLSLFTAILLNNFEDDPKDDQQDEPTPITYHWLTSLKYEYIVAFGTTKAKNEADEQRQQSQQTENPQKPSFAKELAFSDYEAGDSDRSMVNMES
jgi:hypothetical protein